MKKICIGIQVYEQPGRLLSTLQSVRDHTSIEVEFLLLLDGPDEPTRAALAGLRDIGQSATSDPRGAAACFNRLAASTEAETLVFLESGSIVSPGWLEVLLAALNADTRHGLVGPSTNLVWNAQCAFPKGSGDPRSIANTAQEAAQRYGPAWRTLEPLYSLADFCYMMRRAVIEEIGAADEGYGLGPCWEMDYNIRAARAGWRGVWACGAYVYRSPFTLRRQREERLRFEASKQRYQDKFCGLRLQRMKPGYERHCRGEECEHFAPQALIQIQEPYLPTPAADAREKPLPPAPPPVVLAYSPVEPLVSCIMPTYNRREFLPRALHYFLRQDYPNKELIIVDDGTDPVDDLLPLDERIRYIRLAERRTIGAKRNLACQEARGEFIMHWDDDDWYPPERVGRQMRALLDKRSDVCGSSHVYYYDPTTDQGYRYEYTGGASPWVAGNTLAYRRDTWQRSPFPDIQIGEDARFVWSQIRKTVHDLRDPALCIGLLHPANSSRKDTRGICWHPQPIESLHHLLGDDLHFYRGQAGLPPPTRLPLVSCIMPTYNRRTFAPLALQMFAQQDYPNKELLVVDDGTDPVGDLVEAVQGAHYVRLPQRTSIGTKRNLGCQKAQGEVIVHWDDDDWYAPNRLSYQAAPILKGEADLTGLENSYLLALPECDFWKMRPALHQRMFVGDVHGGTLMMRKAVFDQGLRYPDVNLAEDAVLIKLALRQGKRLLRLANPGVFVYVRHGGNTWRFEAGRFLDPKGWERTEPPVTFPAEALERYRKGSLI